MNETKPTTPDEEEKPYTQDHDEETGTLKYELGRAERGHPTNFAAVEAYCYNSTATTTDDLRLDDWLLPVFASGGRIVLWAKIAPEAAHVAFDPDERQMTTLVWNDVFLDYREIHVDQEDVAELVEEAEEIRLKPRHRSRWVQEDAEERDDE